MAAGAAFVVMGRPRADWNAQKKLDLASSVIDATSANQIGVRAFQGIYENDRMGESVATGDIDGDGRMDLCIGADHQDYIPAPNTTFLDVGAVHIINGTAVLNTLAPKNWRSIQPRWY
ncbi:MAG: FG-GAP repeat protein [Candidatus Hinthialibacteria bacterium OLB16]|nr:MAG: FG-GAP repeat protein [Candidatus Hinthialibacteria bacterium OLB16]